MTELKIWWSLGGRKHSMGILNFHRSVRPNGVPPPPRSVFWWDGAGGGPEGRPEGRVDIRGADTGEDGGAPDLVEAADTNAIPVKTWLSLGLRMLLMGLP
jgi:hypothetical protein